MTGSGLSQADQIDTRPLVWIVVLHLSGVEMTRSCLESLRQLRGVRFRTLLVDNGSPDHEGARLEAELPWISLLRLDENTGFSGGCNAGIAHAREQGGDFVWLLNNDATVHPGTLRRLVAVAAENPRAGVLGGAVLENGGSGPEATGEGYVDFARARIYSQGASTDSVHGCDWVCGANMLLRVAALAEAGGFDDDYFLYYEDVELCVRLRDHGWQCLYVPDAPVEHTGRGSTSGPRALWKYYYGARNRLYFFRRYASPAQWRRCRAGALWQLFRHLLLYPVSPARKRLKTRGEFLGIRDFSLGRRGRAEFL